MGKVDLDLPMYARILARLACRRDPSLPQILGELGVDAGELREAEPALRRDLSMAWQERKGIAAMKFAAALGEELSKLALLGGEGGEGAASEIELPRGTDVPSFLQPAPMQPQAEPERGAPPPPMVATPPPRLAGTAEMDLQAVIAAVKGSSLPFAPSDPQTAATHEKSPPAGERPPPVATGTVLDLSGIIPRSSLPFAGAEDVDFAQLPLATYAGVTGALARGEPRDEVLQRHGVRPEVFDTMAKAWAQRFQREPHLLETFKSLVKRGN